MQSPPLRVVARRIARPFSLIAAVLCMLIPVLMAPRVSFAQFTPQGLTKTPPSCVDVTLEADQQRENLTEKILYFDGNVDVRCGEARLRADHVEYDGDTKVVKARGHVQLDYLTQHLDADEARYEPVTGRGEFRHVHGTFAMQRKPTPTLLISPNPLYFDAEVVERLDENTYRISNA